MVQAIRRYAPYADMKRIDEAFHYAEEKHKNQKRKDGSPYIIHPLAVAEIIAEVGLDTDAILAALLHDCLEDTSTTYEAKKTLTAAALTYVAALATSLAQLLRLVLIFGGRDRNDR